MSPKGAQVIVNRGRRHKGAQKGSINACLVGGTGEGPQPVQLAERSVATDLAAPRPPSGVGEGCSLKTSLV